MIKSNLATEVYKAHENNYSKGRSGYKVCKFTPHIMAGVLTAKQCGVNIFQKPTRLASSNYGIGNDGTIACYVGEENRAWTSSSKTNDCQAITVEVSNCEVGGQWRISDAAWNSLVNLAVDVCKRYNFRLVYDGTPNGSLTRHNMFANTACPGPYLQSRFQELADTVNRRLDGQASATQTKTETNIAEKSTVTNYLVRINTEDLNVRKGAGTSFGISTVVHKNEVFTIVEEKMNGNTKWGKLKSGAGWISLAYTVKVEGSSAIQYYPACDWSYRSIVDALNSIGVNSSKENRKKIAIANGIKNYSGTAVQNNQLLAKLKSGMLRK